MKRTALLLALLILIPGCGKVDDPWQGAESPRVMASFPPIYCFAMNVMGEQGKVLPICTTLGPHDYEHNQHDMQRLLRADLLLANGLGLDESFTDRMATNSSNPDLTYVKLGDKIDRAKLAKAPPHEHLPGQPHHHHHGEHDPHIWLGDEPAMQMVKDIGEALAEADPDHAKEYRKRAKAYADRIKKEVGDYGREKLKDMSKTPIVTFHESLTYFGRAFDLNIIDAIRVSPHVEIDPRALTSLVEKLARAAKDHDKLIITTEPQYPGSEADRVRKALKDRGVEVTLVEINPMETAQLNELDADWYIKTMRQNIDNLAKHSK